jgi:hypothetical protein
MEYRWKFCRPKRGIPFTSEGSSSLNLLVFDKWHPLTLGGGLVKTSKSDLLPIKEIEYFCKSHTCLFLFQCSALRALRNKQFLTEKFDYFLQWMQKQWWPLHPILCFLKYFRRKSWQENALFTILLNFCYIFIITLTLKKNSNFFRQTLAQIAENCDHNIDPWWPCCR